jgi:hypothetical protein
MKLATTNILYEPDHPKKHFQHTAKRPPNVPQKAALSSLLPFIIASRVFAARNASRNIVPSI